MQNQNKNKIEIHLATNSANIIGSLNLQIAMLQTQLENMKEQNDDQSAMLQKYKKRIAILEKENASLKNGKEVK